MADFSNLGLGLCRDHVVGGVEQDDLAPGLVAELVDTIRTSDRVLELCLSPPSSHLSNKILRPVKKLWKNL